MIDNHVRKLNAFQSFISFAPMDFMMTICAQCFKICRRIIFPVSVNMMDYKDLDIIDTASITNNFAVIFQRFCKTIGHILKFRCQCTINKIRTATRTKFLFTALESDTTHNSFATQLTWITLYTSNRAVLFTFFGMNREKFFSTCFACAFIPLGIFKNAFSRTIDFPFPTFRIFSLKFFFTNLASIHKIPLTKGSLSCH